MRGTYTPPNMHGHLQLRCHNKARNFIATASDQIESLANKSDNNIQILSPYLTRFEKFSICSASYFDGGGHNEKGSLLECLSKDGGNLSKTKGKEFCIIR